MSESYYESMAERMRHRISATSLIPIQTETQEFEFNGKPKADPEAIQQALSFASRDKSTTCIRTYASFSGADMIIEIDGEVIPEIQAFSFHEIGGKQAKQLAQHSPYYDSDSVCEYPVVIEMDYTLFGGDSFSGLHEGSVYSITLKLINEYGDKRYYHFSGVELVSTSMSLSIDNITSDTSQVLRAKGVWVEIPQGEGQ